MADKIYKSKIGGEVSPVVPPATDPSHAINKQQAEEIAIPVVNSDTPYADAATMYADQANQKKGFIYVVDGVGQFFYKGTAVGDSTDYERVGLNDNNIHLVPSVDDGVSTIYFYDSNNPDVLLYHFIRHNAVKNTLEFGSNNGNGEIISSMIDRGKKDWEFQDSIQILMPGRGVRFATPSFNNSDIYTSGNNGVGKYELIVNDGGVLELWSMANNVLDQKIWGSDTGVGSISNITEIPNRSYNDLQDLPKRTFKDYNETSTYTFQLEDKDRFVVLGDNVTDISVPVGVFSNGDVLAVNEGSNLVNALIEQGDGVTSSLMFKPEGDTYRLKTYGTVYIQLISANAGNITGDLIQEYAIRQSPNGTLWKVSVDNTGSEVITAL
jgi:hypothetical protein